MGRLSLHVKLGTALLGVTLAGAAQGAVVMPYTNDFSVGASDFTSAGGSWAVVSEEYVSTSTAGNQASTAIVEVSNLGAANTTDFIFSTLLTPGAEWQTDSGGSQTMGMASLSNAGLSSYYLTDVSGVETLRIHEVGGAGLLVSGSVPFPVLSGTTYTMTLEGTYELSGDLTLKLTIDNGADTPFSITTTDATPLTGQHFGLRHRSDSNSPNLVIAADDFSIVPEPASMALVGSGLALMLCGRRRSN